VRTNQIESARFRYVIEGDVEPRVGTVARRAVRGERAAVLAVIVGLVAGETVVLAPGRVDRRISGNHVAARTRSRGVPTDQLEPARGGQVIERCAEPGVGGVACDAVGRKACAMLRIEVVLVARDTVALIDRRVVQGVSGNLMAADAGDAGMCTNQIVATGNDCVVDSGAKPRVVVVAAQAVSREISAMEVFVVAKVTGHAVILTGRCVDRVIARDQMTTGAGDRGVCTHQIEVSGRRQVIEHCAGPGIVAVTAGAVGAKSDTVIGVEVGLVAGDTVVLTGRRKDRRIAGNHVAAGARCRIVSTDQVESSGNGEVVEVGP